MSLPVTSTTVTVRRPARAAGADQFDPDTGPPATVATGVRAHFSGVTVTESDDGSSVAYTATLLADPVDLRHGDTVVDDGDGTEWTVGGVRQVVDPDRPAPDNDSHTTAPVARTVGAAATP